MKEEIEAPEQLLDELAGLRQWVADLEAADIERKWAEETLRESEQNFRDLIDNSPEGVLIADEKGAHLFANRRAAEITGYSVDELQNITIREITLPEEINMYRERYRERIEGKPVPRQYECLIVRKDGTTVLTELTTTTTIWKGKACGLATIRDITERKRAEEALRVSEERFALAVRGSDAGLWDWGIPNNSLYWSPRLKELLGYADDELEVDFDTLESFLHPDDREHTGAAIKAHLKDRGLYEVEQRLRTKSGEYRWFRARGQALWDEAGNPLRMIGFTTDITERKRTEEALKEYSERLEEMVEERTKELRDAQEQLVRREKLAVLGQLAGGVGHELRNPLGVISNAVYYLKMVLPDADEASREFLDIISEEVRNSTKIISDLLDFSRTRIPDREEIAVSELAAGVLEKRPPPEEVEATTEIAPDLPPVYVDPHQMELVLANLVANAYQSMPEGGKLTISAQAEEDRVALSISDTGGGIREENMAKLFEPLFTTKARGIGLGLATSRILVEANGGSIEVASKVGKGSTFTVRLPAAEGRG